MKSWGFCEIQKQISTNEPPRIEILCVEIDTEIGEKACVCGYKKYFQTCTTSGNCWTENQQSQEEKQNALKRSEGVPKLPERTIPGKRRRMNASQGADETTTCGGYHDLLSVGGCQMIPMACAVGWSVSGSGSVTGLLWVVRP